MHTYMVYGGWRHPGFVLLRAPERGVRWRQQMVEARKLLRRLYYSHTRAAFHFSVDGAEDRTWDAAPKHGWPRYEWHEGTWREVEPCHT